jgi:chromate transporter
MVRRATAADGAMNEENPRVPLRDIFRVFFMIGATSFGGGLIGWIHRETVSRRRWLTNEQFLSGVALGQVLPGANVTNLAIYIGQLLRGGWGAFIAITAVLAAPFFLCIGFSVIYAAAIGIPGFHAAMDGIAAAAVGMILRLGAMGATHSCRKIIPAVIAVGVFIAIGVLQWPLVPVALITAPISVALAWPRGRADA